MAFEPAARAGRSPMAHQGFPTESARRRGERDLSIVVGMGSRKSSARDDLLKLQSRDKSRDMSEFCEHRSPAFRVARSGGERRGLGAAVSAHAAATAAGSYFLRRRESDETRRTGVAKGGTAHLLVVRRLKEVARPKAGQRSARIPGIGISQEESAILGGGYGLSSPGDRASRCQTAIIRPSSSVSSAPMATCTRSSK
jgi:hypothetical protein